MKNVLLILLGWCVFASLEFPETNTSQKLGLALEKDVFLNEIKLESVLVKLHRLSLNPADSAIHILHVGDSHVQMGHFPGTIRASLQRYFGGEGIGLFFPNGLCGGYNPAGIEIHSPTAWKCEKILNTTSTVQLGIVGFAMETSDSLSTLTIGLKDAKRSVEEIVLFHQKMDQQEQIECPQGTVVTNSFSSHSSLTTIRISSGTKQVQIRFVNKSKSPSSVVLYGLSVNSPSNRGVVYNTFGVSGGQYKYIVQNAPLFLEQFESFHPDLLTISLGTNDSYARDFTADSYLEMVSKFIAKLQQISPTTTIILTTPPDTFYQKTNPFSESQVLQTIHRVSEKYGCVLWDFNQIMGGENALLKWQKANLAMKDGLHFNERGYVLEGMLFNLAFARAYEKKYPTSTWLKEVEGALQKY